MGNAALEPYLKVATILGNGQGKLRRIWCVNARAQFIHTAVCIPDGKIILLLYDQTSVLLAAYTFFSWYSVVLGTAQPARKLYVWSKTTSVHIDMRCGYRLERLHNPTPSYEGPTFCLQIVCETVPSTPFSVWWYLLACSSPTSASWHLQTITIKLRIADL